MRGLPIVQGRPGRFPGLPTSGAYGTALTTNRLAYRGNAPRRKPYRGIFLRLQRRDACLQGGEPLPGRQAVAPRPPPGPRARWRPVRPWRRVPRVAPGPAARIVSSIRARDQRLHLLAQSRPAPRSPRRPRRPDRRRNAVDRHVSTCPCVAPAPSGTRRDPYNARHDPGHRRRRLHRLQPAVAALAARGLRDRRRRPAGHATGKWRNLAKHPPAAPDPARRDLDDFLDSQPAARDGVPSRRHQRTPPRPTAMPPGPPTSSCRADVCGTGAPNDGVRLVYASSAATYGDGTAGFDDDAQPGGAATGCGRSTCMAGPSTPSICRVARAMRARRAHARRNGSASSSSTSMARTNTTRAA